MISTKGGFTAIEMLMTVFIAALFVIGGYQLYGALNLRLANVRELALASNVGYSVLRGGAGPIAPTVAECGSPVSDVVPNPSLIAGADSLPNVKITIRRCKPMTSSSLIRVSVTVEYGSPIKEVTHASYIRA